MTNDLRHIELLSERIMILAEAVDTPFQRPLYGPEVLDLADAALHHIHELHRKVADLTYRLGTAQQERSEWWVRAIAAELELEKKRVE